MSRPEPPDPRLRRRAVAFIPEELVWKILGLPEDVRLLGIQGDWSRVGVEVMLESERFEPVPPGCTPPQLRIEWDWDPENQKLTYTLPTDG